VCKILQLVYEGWAVMWTWTGFVDNTAIGMGWAGLSSKMGSLIINVKFSFKTGVVFFERIFVP
jgi:hypothetical protein